MSVGTRIKELIERSGVTAYEVAVKTGISQPTISRILNDGAAKLNIKNTDLLCEYFGVSRSWLLTGTEDKSIVIPSINLVTNLGEAELIPLLPTSAQGGSLNEFLISVKSADCEHLISPIKGADFALNVAGDSMSPEYPSGSKILIKKINEKAFIDWGKVFVLDTCNGIILKKIVPSEKEGCIRCVSINPHPDYAAYDIRMGDIFGMYRVLLCMSEK